MLLCFVYSRCSERSIILEMDAVKFTCDSHTWLGTRDSWNIYALVASRYLHTRPDDRVPG